MSNSDAEVLLQASDKENGSREKVRRHQNGLIDVTPEGRYIEMAQENAKRSPLLRLPPEIRNIIFKYAVGGRRFPVGNSHWDFHICSEDIGNNRFSLLQTCRQIYTETALLPFEENTFDCSEDLDGLVQWSKSRRAVEVGAITTVQCSVLLPPWMFDRENFCDNLFEFPRLKCVHIRAVVGGSSELANRMAGEHIRRIRGRDPGSTSQCTYPRPH